MPKKRDNVRMGRYQTPKEKAALKIGNNEDCPCGKKRPREVFVKGVIKPKIVSIPIKYKKCCKGKFQFFSDADAKRLGLQSKDEFLKAKELKDGEEQ